MVLDGWPGRRHGGASAARERVRRLGAAAMEVGTSIGPYRSVPRPAAGLALRTDARARGHRSPPPRQPVAGRHCIPPLPPRHQPQARSRPVAPRPRPGGGSGRTGLATACPLRAKGHGGHAAPAASPHVPRLSRSHSRHGPGRGWATRPQFSPRPSKHHSLDWDGAPKGAMALWWHGGLKWVAVTGRGGRLQARVRRMRACGACAGQPIQEPGSSGSLSGAHNFGRGEVREEGVRRAPWRIASGGGRRAAGGLARAAAGGENPFFGFLDEP